MTKVEDWEQAVADVFIERIGHKFVWGTNDCCLFAADCYQAATGCDPANGIRGTYSDAMGAARTVKDLGGMYAIGDRSFGPRIEPGRAVFGDFGLIENGGRQCLAVFGGQYFHAPGDEGLTIFPVETCLRAWSLT